MADDFNWDAYNSGSLYSSGGLQPMVGTEYPGGGTTYLSGGYTNPATATYANDGGAATGNTWSGYTAPSSAPAPDPYAQWGGQSAYNNLVSGFDTQKQGIYDSAYDAADTTASKYNRSILDFLDSSRLGQTQIDRQAQNNELAKLQGVSGVMGMVGRGIRSGGVLLNNKNAGDSSAAGALANAYGQIGRGELGNVGNQYELGNQGVQDAQNAFAVQQASGVRNLQGSKEDSVNAIVNAARDSLAQLDVQMQNASLPDRIAIDQEKAKIKARVLGELQQYDRKLTEGVAGIRPTDADARREAAARLARAGTSLGEDAFSFSTEAPAMWQGAAPSGGSFPLYTIPRKRLA